ncbi:MAG: GIY-YIG nuclease family protein [Bacteroidetes bacterium]|nr:GIY-YIG nuclease family protein [Bacteroidota bacterium]
MGLPWLSVFGRSFFAAFHCAQKDRGAKPGRGGVTNNLTRRLSEHANKVNPGFTARYNCHHLVYYEHFKYINDTISREKYLKGILCSKKEKLISDFNPEWKFLNGAFVN